MTLATPPFELSPSPPSRVVYAALELAAKPKGSPSVSVDPTDWAGLMVAVRDRQDRAAFAALFSHFAPRVKGFLMKAGSDAATAEECAQDVMATLWQKAHQFVLSAYRFTEVFPQKEIYGLTSQFRRAAISIPANIAEGFKKRGRADKVRFLNIAQGSLEECRYYLILSSDLNYGENQSLLKPLSEVSKLLASYTSTILTSY